MLLPKRILLSINLASAIICISGNAFSSTTMNNKDELPVVFKDPAQQVNQSYVSAELLYAKPYTDNLKYATFVSGTQPYFQSWHYLSTTPTFHPAFELTLNYAVPNTNYSFAANWTRLNSNDTDSKQASTNTDLTTVEFVGPPYEMSPPVFGIKSVNSKVNFDFNHVELNAARWVNFGSSFNGKFFAGLSFLDLNETVTTTFGDYAGSPPTPYSYPLPPDPSFSFQTENTSRYFGAGPDIGVDLTYTMDSGFGFMGEFSAIVTAGTIKAKDNFTSTSARLTALGIGTSHQEITAPNDTQVVLGTDSKLGIFYTYHGANIPSFTIEAGYRIAAYINAVSTISPNTLVQPGTVITTPEFATGTMAIVSTLSKTGPFSYSGPFINIKIALG